MKRIYIYLKRPYTEKKSKIKQGHENEISYTTTTMVYCPTCTKLGDRTLLLATLVFYICVNMRQR